MLVWPGIAAANQGVTFADLPGWADDDHGAAFEAFRRSCERLDFIAAERAETGKAPGPEDAASLSICKQALKETAPLSNAAAQSFFERHFLPHPVSEGAPKGLVTGYFEPELEGAREPSERFHVPVYAKPEDLVALFPDAHRAAHNHEISAGRQTADGVVPFATRQDIEKGALEGQGLEILYLADRFDAYIMHVQGSGRIVLPDGKVVRLAYAAKNGHPYTSIGRVLIDQGEITKEDMSLAALEAWVRGHPEKAEALMWHNRSYIFFREIVPESADIGPLGGQSVALTPGRSLAVDASIHALGSPIWVEAQGLAHGGARDFRRLMVAQDVGSAIKGPERGDIFWGSGAAAGEIAGNTQHRCRFWVLRPRAAKTGG